MKTYYEGHDKQYQKLKSNGSIGWDKTASAYAELEAHLLEIIESGHAPRSGRLLELGCGAGNISLWLAKQGYEVEGIDISETAINWAKSKAGEEGVTAKFHVGSVLNMTTFKENTFDFVLDGHCFHCIIGSDRSTFLAEAYRVLKPGGFFLIHTMCGPVTSGKLEGYDPETKCTVFQEIATRYFGLPEEIMLEVSSSGFDIATSNIEKEEDSHDTMTIQAFKPK